MRYMKTNDSLSVRPTTEADIPRLMVIFEMAKGIMRTNGNMHQWTGTYPSIELLTTDIQNGHSFVCETPDGTVVGTFAFILGTDPTYAKIYDGEWLDEERPYGVIHRIASTPDSHGVAVACIDFCAARTPNLRVDTHRDNSIMRHIMMKHGFHYCGIIYLANGDERLAYQRIITTDMER